MQQNAKFLNPAPPAFIDVIGVHEYSSAYLATSINDGREKVLIEFGG